MGKLAAFVTMFAFIFVATVGIAFFIPLLMVYIAWDTSNLNIDWELVYMFLRVNIVFSTFMGIGFMISKEGKAFANDFNEYIESKRK